MDENSSVELFGFVFKAFLQLIILFGLVMFARSRRTRCDWTAKKAIRIAIFSGIGLFLMYLSIFIASGPGLAVVAYPFLVYYLALSIFRRLDLGRTVALVSPTSGQVSLFVNQPDSPPLRNKSKMQFYVLLAVAAWISLVGVILLVLPSIKMSAATPLADFWYTIQDAPVLSFIFLSLPAILFGSILAWWSGKGAKE